MREREFHLDLCWGSSGGADLVSEIGVAPHLPTSLLWTVTTHCRRQRSRFFDHRLSCCKISALI